MISWLRGVGAVVFDAVGTLIHPRPPAPLVYAEVGRRFGSRLDPPIIAGRFRAAIEREEAWDRQHGLRTSETRETERWRRIVFQVLDDVTDPDACFQELFQHFGTPQAWQCDPQADSVLSELAGRGRLLGIASNYDRRLRLVVAGLPELEPFRNVVISSEVGWRKPAPQFYQALCQEVGLAAEKILHVGDDLANDYEGAQAVGMRAVLFDPENKAGSTAALRIRRLDDLLAGDP
jgi:putative hydrolase of the HAD superfamily